MGNESSKEPEKPEELEIVPLSDSRFIGEFGNNIGNKFYPTYAFDGTNKVIYYSSSKLEFQILDGKYRQRTWSDKNYYNFSEWLEYEFTNNGNTLRLQSYKNLDFWREYEKDNTNPNYDENGYCIVTITDSRLVGTWRRRWVVDAYGEGSPGESGYDYTLTISEGGSYTYTSQKYRLYNKKYTYENEVNSSISLNKIELYMDGKKIKIGDRVYLKG
jgi:hypothetical protein